MTNRTWALIGLIALLVACAPETAAPLAMVSVACPR